MSTRQRNKSAPGTMMATSDIPEDIMHPPAYAPGYLQTDQTRTTAPSIESLSVQVAALTDMVQTVLGTIQNNGLIHQRQIEQLATENGEWRRVVADLTQNMSKTSWEKFRQPSKSILIGSSLIRDVHQDNLLNTSVICKSGGTIDAIDNIITNELPKDEHYHTMTLVVGGNDCATTPPTPANEVIDKFAKLIDNAKTRAKSVVVSSVCPRMKEPEVTETISLVNAALQVTCAAKEVTYADSASSFYLRDGNVNDGYLLKDGVHLTNRATNKLAHHLGLPIKDSNVGVCKQRHHQIKQTTKLVRKNQQQTPNHKDEHTDESWTTVKHGRHRHTTTPAHQHTERTHTRYSYSYCKFCGEHGHNSDTCRHGKEIECRSCRRSGHKAKLCRLY